MLVAGTWIAHLMAGAGRWGKGLMGYLRAGWWRPPGTRPHNLRELAALQVEKLRTSMASGVLTFLPHYDGVSRETPEIRDAYREMERDGTVKAALRAKVLAVASLALQVHPDDKDDPESRRQADFVAHCFRRVEGGHPRLARVVLHPALVDGWSLTEKRTRPEREGPWKGKIVWDRWKSKDTKKADLGLDNYRNVEVVRGSANNASRYFDVDDFVIFSHFPQFENPYGTSELRAAYRPFWIKDSVWRLRGVHLDRFGSPFLKGTYQPGDSTVREALEEALERAKASTWLTIPQGAAVDVIEMAGRGTGDYESAIQDCDREILLAVSGATLQSVEGRTTGARSMGEVHADQAELGQWYLSEELGRIYSREAELLVRMNFAEPRPPTVTLESISQAALKERAEVDEKLQRMGYRLSRREGYEVYGRAEPVDDADELKPGGDQQGGAGGVPGMPPGGGGGQPPAPEAPPGFGEWAEAARFADSDPRACARLLRLARSLGPACPEGLRKFASDWVQEKGPRGGTRWRNSKTGKIAYGKKNPGGEGKEKKEEAPGGKKAAAPQPAAPQAAAPQETQSLKVGGLAFKGVFRADGTKFVQRVGDRRVSTWVDADGTRRGQIEDAAGKTQQFRAPEAAKPPGPGKKEPEPPAPPPPPQQPEPVPPPEPEKEKKGKGKPPPAPPAPAHPHDAPGAPAHAALFHPDRPPLVLGHPPGEKAWARKVQKGLDRHLGDGLNVPADEMKALVGEDRYDRLVADGSLRPNQAGTHVQAGVGFYQQLDDVRSSDPGASVRPPQTLADAAGLARDYRSMPADQQRKVRDYLGLTDHEARSDAALRTALTDRLDQIHNPVPMETRIATHDGLRKTLEKVHKVAEVVKEKQEAARRAKADLEAAQPAFREARLRYATLGRDDPREAAKYKKEEYGRLEKEFNKKADASLKADLKAKEAVKGAREKIRKLLQVKDASPVEHKSMPFAEGSSGHEAATEATAFLSGLLAKGPAGEALPPVGLEDLHAGLTVAIDRAHYLPGAHTVVAEDLDGPYVHAHELGHAIEEKMPGAQQAVRAFLRGRVAGEQAVQMRDVMPGASYHEGETGRKDHFEAAFGGDLNMAYYTGRENEHASTEVLAMGVQQLYEDPVGFAQADPEYFALVVGVLNGTLRHNPIPA